VSEESIVPAAAADWEVFLALATAEGWRVPQNEIAFHRRAGANTAFALRRAGETVGFITAVPHQHSGWIGNLLIAPQERGKGYGARLFDAATALLVRQGITSLWLTASALGAPLYERRGFVRVGEVVRWARPQGGEGKKVTATAAKTGIQCDVAVWGELRGELLRSFGRHGRWLQREGGVALLQDGPDLQVVGPWLTLRHADSPYPLLEDLVQTAAPGRELVVDAIERQECCQPLQAAGFLPQGRNGLMVKTLQPFHLPARAHALASLGSIG